jgi:CBS domain-containing protein
MPPRASDRTVRDIMAGTPVTVSPDLTIPALLELFEAHDFNLFPVVAENHLLGVVSKLDLLMAFRPGRRRHLSDVDARRRRTVRDIMSRGLVVVEPDHPVTRAVDLMVEHGMRALPVVERHPDGLRLLGLVSRGDALRCLVPGEVMSRAEAVAS